MFIDLVFLISLLKHGSDSRSERANTKYKLLLMRASSIINKFSSSRSFMRVQLGNRVQLHVLDAAVRRRNSQHITTSSESIFTFLLNIFRFPLIRVHFRKIYIECEFFAFVVRIEGNSLSIASKLQFSHG